MPTKNKIIMEALIVISFVVLATAACVKFKVFGTPKETRW